MPGYEVKQERIAIPGVADLVIRSLLDKQQFSDPQGDAERLGISSSLWPLFGLLWPSGSHLAARLGARRIIPGDRILEIGCGLGLASLVGHRAGADVTASDCHPLAGRFLSHNLVLNDLGPMKYRHGQWPGVVLPRDAIDERAPVVVHGEFDLVIGSDVLYERDERGTLADFIAGLVAPAAEVWIVDPNRGNRSAFHRNMARHGFRMEESLLDQDERDGIAAYKGRMLTYRRQ
ncbi:MAG: SAM-dependent methyltransferase [Burkholderiaceae bacterium]